MDRVEVGGRVHLQMNTTSEGALEPGAEFLLRRARIWVGARVNEWIDGVAQIDVAGGRATARYAFVRFSLAPELALSFGQFKRAFDLFELTSSSQTLVVERDGDIRGAEPCGGLGRVCSYSAFTEALELSSLDVGMAAEGELAGGRARYSVTFTNGAGDNRLEDNDGKSASARLEVSPLAGLTLGGNLAVHDYDGPAPGEVSYAPAAAVDAEWGGFDAGWHVQAGVLTGENWRHGGTAPTFRAAQAILSHRFQRSADGRVRGVEPVGRVSLGDPDTGTAADGGLLLTPGLIVHFEGRNRVAANVDVWSPSDGGSAWSLKVQTNLYF
ncbi:MAG: OprO/OprP family phosphate-selective porin [Gemmatimonadetes bacterium]|nr:OprO/OprP family phosphate-selective porin [Gemmatimonadota bacterium]